MQRKNRFNLSNNAGSTPHRVPDDCPGLATCKQLFVIINKQIHQVRCDEAEAREVRRLALQRYHINNKKCEEDHCQIKDTEQ
jgi:hypothetical protein